MKQAESEIASLLALGLYQRGIPLRVRELAPDAQVSNQIKRSETELDGFYQKAS